MEIARRENKHQPLRGETGQQSSAPDESTSQPHSPTRLSRGPRDQEPESENMICAVIASDERRQPAKNAEPPMALERRALEKKNSGIHRHERNALLEHLV